MSPFRWLVALGCAYEIAALHQKSPLPTISQIVKQSCQRPLLRVAAWLWCGAWAWHFMVDVHTCECDRG